MPIGKGYFWDGLSQGVRGLYGSMQNERMANEAQGARAEEGGLDRAAAMSRLAKTLGEKPRADTLNPDYDSILNALKLAQSDLSKHEGDYMGQASNPDGWAYDRAVKEKAVKDLSDAEKKMRKPVMGRHGVEQSGKTSSRKEDFYRNLLK